MDDQAQKRFIGDWSRVRNQGVVRYVLLHGFLSFGIPVLIVTNLVLWQGGKPSLIWGALNDQVVTDSIWIALVGVAVGFVKWYLNQNKYRNIGSKGVC